MKAPVTVPTFDKQTIRAIIGLGNPGSKYVKTRHNIGFRVLDELAVRLGALWHKTELMETATVNYNGSTLYLIKPLTFMNSSGQVLSSFLKKGIKPEEILVIHDELEKPFGSVNMRFGGSARGHNGLKSIIERVGFDFWRLRFGIGRPEDKSEVFNYVLAQFSREEEERIGQVIDQAISLILT